MTKFTSRTGLSRRALLKGAASTAIAAGSTTLGAPMLWAQNIKDVTIRQFGTGVSNLNDVANKVGEMERFMDVSKGVVNSIDLQNGVFEEEGLKMLEEWERTRTSKLLGGNATPDLLNSGQSSLDINETPHPEPRALPRTSSERNDDNNYNTSTTISIQYYLSWNENIWCSR